MRARLTALLGFATSGVIFGVGIVLVATAGSASAGTVPDGGTLSVLAAPTVLSDESMSPGDNIYWPINVGLNASTSGHLTLKVVSSNPLATNPAGLHLALASCTVPWTMGTPATDPPTCSGTTTSIIPDQPFASISPTKVWDIGTVARVSTLPMIATISLAGSVPIELQGAQGDMDFGFTALGTTVHADPSDPAVPILAHTGVDPLGPLLLAAGLLLAGFTLARVRRSASRNASRSATSNQSGRREAGDLA